MRKPLVIGGTALALLFGGGSIANATELSAATPATTTTTLAQEAEDDGGDNGLWGLAGLVGLAGLAGLVRRKDRDHAVNRAGTANPPRV
ncbi:MAG: hypothetical protein ICV72_11780 [Aldersonia sp.]|nr:hypothetical protein [Aldersonia sp.]